VKGPVHSKIIKYLFVYEAKLYNELVGTRIVPEFEYRCRGGLNHFLKLECAITDEHKPPTPEEEIQIESLMQKLGCEHSERESMTLETSKVGLTLLLLLQAMDRLETH